MWKAICTLFCLLLLACTQQPVKYVQQPVCPYGVPPITQSDYIVLSDPAQISDQFVDWVIANGLFCEKTGGNK